MVNNQACLNWDFDMSPFSSAPLWSNFESIAIHNCTGISQTRIYSPPCKRKIDSRKGAWEEGTQRPAARIQRRDWPRVWEFQPSFESTCVHRVWVEGNRRCWCHHSLRFFLPALLLSRKERKILGTRNVSKIFKYNLQCLAIKSLIKIRIFLEHLQVISKYGQQMLSSIKFILIFIVLITKCYLHLPQTLNGFWHYWHYSRFTTTWQGRHVAGQCKMVFSSQRPFPEVVLGHQHGRCDVTCKNSNTLSLKWQQRFHSCLSVVP